MVLKGNSAKVIKYSNLIAIIFFIYFIIGVFQAKLIKYFEINIFSA